MRTLVLSFFIVIIFINFSYSDESITKIEKNWNEIISMSGNFLQIDPDGEVSNGKFYFLKPYKSKFQYDDRSENIVTNESLLRIVDDEGYQIESYYIKNNILKSLLSNNLIIENNFKNIFLTENDNLYKLELYLDDYSNNNSGIIYFDKISLDLKKWEIIDEFSNKTVLEFTKIKKNISISENLFVVRYKN